MILVTIAVGKATAGVGVPHPSISELIADAERRDCDAADGARELLSCGVATETDRFVFRRKRVQTSMIILGLILLLLGAVLAIPIFWTIGIVLVVVGLVLMLLGRSGRQVGSRAHYW